MDCLKNLLRFSWSARSVHHPISRHGLRSKPITVSRSFDAAAAVTALSDVGKQPACVSLHATKVLGIGEGGAILTSDTELAERTTAMTASAFWAQNASPRFEAATIGFPSMPPQSALPSSTHFLHDSRPSVI